MSGAMHFIQECPTCGRRVQVRLEYLGRRLACDHCGGQFTATASEHSAHLANDQLLHRAERLLASAEGLRASEDQELC